MAWQTKFESQAEKELSSLDNSVKIRILKYLRKLEGCEDPRTLGKPLTENFFGYWRYRVGNYRIVFRICDTELVILLLAIRKRDVVYKIKP
ncbi:MAG: type II toxin-antitoxin system RelE/ParE family toxin [Sphaerochaetaceae bacterium]|jgi:mRNA interferase RelE/StbE|nr:type II toxin-antitoxin system RelE/ParE family toxin [Sphaerochaetaceae bacterium]MDD2406651.1 type II toxin-antitoxin system RelE/ParE family toxin [Sphaerochaetaceae bacterium]MDD3671802.1 type II toxin-antitoxin system RelE/ParE family toxin [Sphaerochaetaceae bacterium]MDD4259601.1 type II toxin-antitoxin system RelE/ParE family toxin [Sphaerochaetaceae bacterium]MDD4842466.1 type II toxin-antitoxin system RelE/ParE family toxin [Sphaerochaetaceae bacterium]